MGVCSDSELCVQGGSPLVGSFSGLLERSSREGRVSSADDCLGCLVPRGRRRLGRSLRDADNGWSLVCRGISAPHQCSGAPGRDICCPVLCPSCPEGSCVASDGQSVCCRVREPHGRHSEPAVEFASRGPVALVPGPPNHHSCRVHSRGPQCHSRFLVSQSQFLRVASASSGVCLAKDPIWRLPRGSLCHSDQHAATGLCFMVSGPTGGGDGCVLSAVAGDGRVCVSSLLPDRQGPTAGSDSSCPSVAPGHPIVARGLVVPNAAPDGVGGADVATTRQVPVVGSSRQSSPIDGQCPAPLGRVAHLRHSYSMSGFSAAVSDLLVASWRTNTSRHYDSAWALWSRWCAQRSIDPLRPALTRVLEFLSDQFQDGRAFRTISGYRSALSTMLPPVDGTSVGSHPTVVRLLRGAYNLRPPAPRYTFTWDVQLVLDFLRSWPDVSDLSDKQLTLRLAMLLALSGAYRCGELCLLSSVFAQLSDGSVRLPLLGTRKTQRVGEPLQTVQVCPFSVAALCPVQHLLEYGRRSAVWRLDGSGPLLLSFRKPHKPVSSPTVARWLKEVLGLAGIDTAQFSAHSSRGAATSAAARAGVSTAVILAAADWKRATTFRRFYCRDVTPPADCFSAAVLRSATA
eukprot:scpid18224/ scgid10901/ 